MPSNTGPDITGALRSWICSVPLATEATCTSGTAVRPLIPRTRVRSLGEDSSASFATVPLASTVRLAPVSSMKRNGPLPLIMTGATIMPMRPGRVAIA